MNWQQQWHIIGVRIDRLVAAAQLLLSSHMDYYGSCGAYFVPQVRDALDQIRILVKTHGNSLPPAFVECFSNFEQKHGRIFQKNDAAAGLPAQISVLAGLKAELEFLLADTEVRTRNLTERAFIHLQRLLVADADVASKWQAADEVACERMGGVHLLYHGIWAFKVDAGSGGRTDLVLGTPLTSLDEARDISAGLVLTEWKRIRDTKDADTLADQAFLQAEEYSQGILAGFELAGTRYLVLVADEVLRDRPPRQGRTALYKYININTRPSPPSITARVLNRTL